MHDGMQYDPIQGHGEGHEPFKVGNSAVFKCYFLRHLQRELATEHGFLNLVFVSRDFEVVRNVSSADSTVSPVQG